MILQVSADGGIVAQTEAPYPAPADTLAHMRAQAQDGTRFLDVPPYTLQHWHVPPGSDVPVPKALPGTSISAATVQADEVETVTLSGLPAGATIRVDGASRADFQVGAGDVEIAFSGEGRHEVTVSAAGCLEERHVVMARRPDDGGAARKARRLARAEGRRRYVIGLPGDRYALSLSAAIDAHFDALAARVGQALAQAPEAERHLAGQPSSRMAALAFAAGVSADDLARAILDQAESYWLGEASRLRVKARLTAMAGSLETRKTDVLDYLRSEGVDLPERPAMTSWGGSVD